MILVSANAAGARVTPVRYVPPPVDPPEGAAFGAHYTFDAVRAWFRNEDTDAALDPRLTPAQFLVRGLAADPGLGLAAGLAVNALEDEQDASGSYAADERQQAILIQQLGGEHAPDLDGVGAQANDRVSLRFMLGIDGLTSAGWARTELQKVRDWMLLAHEVTL